MEVNVVSFGLPLKSELLAIIICEKRNARKSEKRSMSFHTGYVIKLFFKRFRQLDIYNTGASLEGCKGSF